MDKVETTAIQQVLSGDRDAYRVLMDRYFHSVHRITFRITGNQADAEEAAQETFLRAYNKLSSFRQDATFSTWITRIAMNTAINLVERRNRDLTRNSPSIADNPNSDCNTIQIADAHPNPERLLLDNEATSLRHMEDIPIPEIATALNITSNSAKQAVFRAVSKLRRSLAPLAGGLQ